MTVPPAQVEHYETALRGIAAAVVRARRNTNSMGRLREGEGEELMCQVEHHLSTLIAYGAIPAPRPQLGGTQ